MKNKDKQRPSKLTLQPLNYEQAVTAFLKVKPEPKQKRRPERKSK